MVYVGHGGWKCVRCGGVAGLKLKKSSKIIRIRNKKNKHTTGPNKTSFGPSELCICVVGGGNVCAVEGWPVQS